MKKLTVTFVVILMLLVVVYFTKGKVFACGGWFEDPCGKGYEKEIESLQKNQETIISNVPVPKIQTSQERLNIKRRAELFNNENKISYIYLVSYGKVMSFFSIKGKVSSLRSYMVPQEQLVRGGNKPCPWSASTGSCYVVQAPDIDGSYGDNADGIFFFTTEGAYVEWKGEYLMSDQPLKLTTAVELVREIK